MKNIDITSILEWFKHAKIKDTTNKRRLTLMILNLVIVTATLTACMKEYTDQVDSEVVFVTPEVTKTVTPTVLPEDEVDDEPEVTPELNEDKSIEKEDNMKNNGITTIPEQFKHALNNELQGNLVEVSYNVSNYIDQSRKLVTNENSNTSITERESIIGDEINKKCNVYLPAGYDQLDTNNRYDVLYLLHGVGGNRYEWLNGSGYIDENYVICNILDNLIANGDIKPLIVVFPEGRSSIDWEDSSFTSDGTNMLGFYYFDYELRYDLIPFIEKEFNTYANIKDTSATGIEYNRLHRGIAGLSMGGMQSLNLILGGYRCDSTKYTNTISNWGNGLDTTVLAPGMLDLFAYVGSFSNAPTSSDGNVLGTSITSQGHKLELLYIICGDEDGIAYEAGYKRAVEGLMDSAKDSIEDYQNSLITDGKHDFQVWNIGAYNFIQKAFNN